MGGDKVGRGSWFPVFGWHPPNPQHEDTHTMGATDFEKLAAWRLAVRIAAEVWKLVMTWNGFARNAVGNHIVCFPTSAANNQEPFTPIPLPGC